MTSISKKTCTACAAAVVLLGAAFFLPPHGAHNGDALAGPARQATAESGETTAPDQWKTVPADPLSPDGVSWTPLTRDGSN
jgi:hypothetical protein